MKKQVLMLTDDINIQSVTVEYDDNPRNNRLMAEVAILMEEITELKKERLELLQKVTGLKLI